MTVRLQDFQNAGDLAELVGWLEHGAQVGLGRRELMLERMLGGQRPLMLWAQLHQKRSLQLSGQRKHQGHCQILQLLTTSCRKLRKSASDRFCKPCGSRLLEFPDISAKPKENGNLAMRSPPEMKFVEKMQQPKGWGQGLG